MITNMLKVNEHICGKCGACVAVCQPAALELGGEGLSISLRDCNLCGECVLVCPIAALEMEDEE